MNVCPSHSHMQIQCAIKGMPYPWTVTKYSMKVLINPYFQDNDPHYFMSFWM